MVVYVLLPRFTAMTAIAYLSTLTVRQFTHLYIGYTLLNTAPQSA